MSENNTKKKLFKALVLGNGPSLKQGFFKEIIDSCVPCIGMNAAYRFWERIGWYPYAYACADIQLGLSHADKIFEMIDKGLCKHFLLRANMLQLYPELSSINNVIFLEQLNPDYVHVCKQYGIESTPSPFFKSRFVHWITTGGIALRLAAYLGFKRLGMLGIDCNYVEILPESEHDSRGQNVLRIAKTPKKNPNYFFNDYQQKGDIYHVPNPGSEKKPDDPALHFVAIQSVNIDNRFFNYGLDISICTKESELYRQGIFPYCSLNEFLIEDKIKTLEKPFYSIITVTKNSSPSIVKTIESVLAQDYIDYEYIIVDLNSTDKTLSVIQEYAPLFEGRMVWFSEPDNGIYKAMNMGVRISCGNCIITVKSGNCLEADACSYMLNVIQQNPNYGIYHGAQIWHHPNRSTGLSFFNHENLDESSSQHGVSFIDRDVYTQIGGYNEIFRFAGDHHFFLSAKAKGCLFLNIPEKVVSHYYLSENSSRIKKIYRKEMFYAALLVEKNDSFFKKSCWFGFLFSRRLSMRYKFFKAFFFKQFERLLKAIIVIIKNPTKIFYYMNRTLEMVRHKLFFTVF